MFSKISIPLAKNLKILQYLILGANLNFILTFQDRVDSFMPPQPDCGPALHTVTYIYIYITIFGRISVVLGVLKYHRLVEMTKSRTFQDCTCVLKKIFLGNLILQINLSLYYF